ncbi:uncharacterized protein DS421_20g698090 [Arachis hypogaea]|nr:uncharacterized protein DS421_20g698090 [Arachis hypogaea]
MLLRGLHHSFIHSLILPNCSLRDIRFFSFSACLLCCLTPYLYFTPFPLSLSLSK